jgi:hypothetical protein
MKIGLASDFIGAPSFSLGELAAVMRPFLLSGGSSIAPHWSHSNG